MAARKSKSEEMRQAGKDPDAVVSSRIGERLERELKRRNINLGKSECGIIGLSIILEFVQSRAMEWAFSSPIRGIGDPDAETLGIAEAVLPLIGAECDRHELPLDLPVTDWPKEAAAYLFTIGFLAIHAQRVQTLERQGPREFSDDDIPF